MRRQIPNLITLCNLLCGVLACFFAVEGYVLLAALCICLGIFFDFFDGLAARLLEVASPLGKELDSLADVVTSGVAPSFILLALTWDNEVGRWLAWLAVLMPLFAAYRLAKFNLDTRQSHSFRGLPVPANALIWVGLAAYGSNPAINTAPVAIALIAVSIVTDILMVSDLPMFSLKFNFKDMGWRSNSVRYIFLAGCLMAIVLTQFEWYSLSIIILWYIILSLFTCKRHDAE